MTVLPGDDPITVAVLPAGAAALRRVERLSSDLAKLRRFCDRLSTQGELRGCDEASSAGYVVHRAMTSWGFSCDGIAPSLIPPAPESSASMTSTMPPSSRGSPPHA